MGENKTHDIWIGMLSLFMFSFFFIHGHKHTLLVTVNCVQIINKLITSDEKFPMNNKRRKGLKHFKMFGGKITHK